MKTSNLLKKFLRSASRTQSVTSTFMHPAREWVVGLFVALAILIGGVSYASYYFWYRVHDIDETYTSQNAPLTYQSEMVAETLELYHTRKAMFGTLREEAGSGPAVSVEEDVDVNSEGSLNAE